MKIAILYICTGLYDVFWKDFYLSFEKNFIHEASKHYYVFTDASSLYGEAENSNIHRIYQEPYPWPYSTLKRYHMFMPYLDDLKKYDYVFFMNANIICKSQINATDILPRLSLGEHLTVVQHPYFFNKKPRHFTYDRNPNSTAYIPYTEGSVYICGGVNGGTSVAFCTLIESIYMQTEQDLQKNIIALWHDESHINKYILNREDLRILQPSYCYPEGKVLPFSQILVVREKNKWIPVDNVKNTKSNFSSKFKKFTFKVYSILKSNLFYYKELIFK